MKRVIFLSIILLFNTIVYAGNILKGIRISYNITEDQIRFIDDHFDFVMTPFLSHEIRSSIQKPKLLLYRSIQGTWTNFDQFDWEHINSHENMFCHSDSANRSPETRILTIWDSWLMDGADLVDSTAADAMDHWVNYYAVTASTQVYSFDYDGLFIDSAGHKLSGGAVNGVMPWDYDDDAWRDGRYAALSFIKSYLPDKTVIFNGLHSDNGADSSLSFTDGAMWEDFVYNIDDGSYKGAQKWWSAIQCLQAHNKSSDLVLVVKKPGLVQDTQARIFSVASCLLVSSPHVALALADWSHQRTVQYYPEYEISLGEPRGNFTVRGDSLFMREFDNGLVLVNPLDAVSRTFTLAGTYYRLVPEGGGPIGADGSYDGSLTYEVVSGVVDIPPVSGLILRDSPTTGVAAPPSQPDGFALAQNYPNPFNPTTMISYRLAQSTRVTLDVYNIRGQKVRTLAKGWQSAGSYTVVWDGLDDNGEAVASAVYLYQIKTRELALTRRMILIR